MWTSERRRELPVREPAAELGEVTLGGDPAGVSLGGERRGLEVYAPAGYHWTPQPGQRVLVIQGDGEVPCIVGVRQGTAQPDSVGISADSVSVGGQSVSIQAAGSAAGGGQSVELQGQVFVNGETLESLIARIVAAMLGGGVLG